MKVEERKRGERKRGEIVVARDEEGESRAGGIGTDPRRAEEKYRGEGAASFTQIRMEGGKIPRKEEEEEGITTSGHAAT